MITSYNRDLTDTYYIQLLKDFNIPLNKSNELDESNGYTYNLVDLLKDVINLQGGEVLVINWLRPMRSMTYYAYIIGYYKNDKFIRINKECCMSKNFIEMNKIIFNDVTTAFDRELKINKILA